MNLPRVLPRDLAEKIVSVALSRPDKIFVSDDLLHLFPATRDRARRIRQLLKASQKAGFIERLPRPVCKVGKNEGTAYVGYRIRGIDPTEIFTAHRDEVAGRGTPSRHSKVEA